VAERLRSPGGHLLCSALPVLGGPDGFDSCDWIITINKNIEQDELNNSELNERSSQVRLAKCIL
jgi:hypothetical protein